jgi:hypothetical protein
LNVVGDVSTLLFGLVFLAIGAALVALIVYCIAVALFKLLQIATAIQLNSSLISRTRMYFMVFAGALAGSITASVAYNSAESWDCTHYPRQNCPSSMSFMPILTLAPLGWLLGSILGFGWTICTLRVLSHKTYASIHRYSGQAIFRNRLLGWGSSIGFWIILGVVAFYEMIPR